VQDIFARGEAWSLKKLDAGFAVEIPLPGAGENGKARTGLREETNLRIVAHFIERGGDLEFPRLPGRREGRHVW